MENKHLQRYCQLEAFNRLLLDVVELYTKEQRELVKMGFVSLPKGTNRLLIQVVNAHARLANDNFKIFRNLKLGLEFGRRAEHLQNVAEKLFKEYEIIRQNPEKGKIKIMQ